MGSNVQEAAQEYVYFAVTVNVNFSHDQREAGRQAVNLAVVGNKDCNVYDASGKIVTAPWVTPEAESELVRIHRLLHMTHSGQLYVRMACATGEFEYSLTPFNGTTKSDYNY